VLSRALSLFAVSMLALSTAACTSLTRPEEITISAEPIARPQPAAREGAAAHAPHGPAVVPPPAPGRAAQPAGTG
jgi:hypothetical protein